MSARSSIQDPADVVVVVGGVEFVPHPKVAAMIRLLGRRHDLIVAAAVGTVQLPFTQKKVHCHLLDASEHPIVWESVG